MNDNPIGEINLITIRSSLINQLEDISDKIHDMWNEYLSSGEQIGLTILGDNCDSILRLIEREQLDYIDDSPRNECWQLDHNPREMRIEGVTNNIDKPITKEKIDFSEEELKEITELNLYGGK